MARANWEADFVGFPFEVEKLSSEALSNLISGIKVNPPDFKLADNVKAETEISSVLDLNDSARNPNPKESEIETEGYSAIPE
jgi:hypothetical protein